MGPSPASEPESGIAVPGVRALDHTADVGLEIHASDLPELFRRAGRGLMYLLLDEDPFPAGLPPEGIRERGMSLQASDLPDLLREWLRELLQWYEIGGVCMADARFESITRNELEGTVRGARTRLEPVREIKGVTLHGLSLERAGPGWQGRVIFDV